MTNVDVAALAAELAPLVIGARFEKAYQPERDVILLRLRRKGTGKTDLLFQLGKFFTATRRATRNPDKPSMLAQVLRNTFENARITGFRQIGFDRLLRMDLERGDGRRSIVFELFGDGNLVVLDEAGVIELPMRGSDFGARKVRKGETWLPPPGGARPFDLDATTLGAKAQGQRDPVRFLAVILGFGPLWAEELCLRAEVPKNTPIDQMDGPAWERLHAAIQQLGRDIERNDLAPALVYRVPAAGAAPELEDAVPFVMRRYPAPEFAQEEAGAFREVLDLLFVGGPEDEDEIDDPRRERFEEAKARINRQLAQVDEAIAGFRLQEAAAQADGDALYASFPLANGIISGLQRAHADKGWPDVAAALAKGREEGNPAAKAIVELRPHNGTALLRLTALDGAEREVEVNIRRSVQENAEACYDAAKKARSRREGAQGAHDDAMRRLRDLEAKGLDGFGTAPVVRERVSRHFWFEAYRWSITPSGLIAVGGRSASQNDAVVKRYLRDGDRYVHAEIHGAPSIVVRPAEGNTRDVANDDLRAACHFAVVASRAWRQFGPATAYWVNASQVSKTPRSGEFVPRGAWIVHGKRNVEPDLPMRWWAGMVRFRLDGTPIPDTEPDGETRIVTKLVGADRTTMARYGRQVVEFVPGTMDPNDAAQDLAARFGVTVEEAQAVIPAGPVEIRAWAPGAA